MSAPLVPPPVNSAKSGKRKRKERFSRYIHRVLVKKHPTMGIRSTAMATMNSLLLDMFQDLGQLSGEMARTKGTKTLSANDVQAATKVLFGGLELGKEATDKGTQAVALYKSSMPKKPKA